MVFESLDIPKQAQSYCHDSQGLSPAKPPEASGIKVIQVSRVRGHFTFSRKA